jgi:hypothetical protein
VFCISNSPQKRHPVRMINPEFKDLAQTWGSKMITVHEKVYL